MTGDNNLPIPPPSPDDVLFEKFDGGYAVITLNRPVVLNAINWSICRCLKVALDKAEEDDDVKVVIFTGAGRAFCAGGDIQSTPPTDGLPSPSAFDLQMRLWDFPKPIIGAVRGHAVGQGHELSAMCDITIAADDARFGELQIRHGFGPPVLISPYMVNPKQAKELLLLGEQLDAEQAMKLGLVNRIVPVEKLMDEAIAMAKKLAGLNQKTVRMNKILVNRVYELAGFKNGLNYRNDPVIKEMGGAMGGGRDANEHLKVLREKGWEAFRESRDAAYRG
jgi:enoyl-CoA hydratase/carnithine racemase